MLNLDAILAQVLDPNITEEQLQQLLQQITTGFTETSVALKISKEEINKSFAEGHALQNEISQLIQCEDAQQSKTLTENILAQLDTSIQASIANLNSLLQGAENDPVLQQESASVRQIVTALQSNVDANQLNTILATIQSKLSANQSALAVQQSRLDQMLANASLTISEDVKSKIESASSEERLEIYKELITVLESQVQENIASYRAYQQSQQPTPTGNGVG